MEVRPAFAYPLVHDLANIPYAYNLVSCPEIIDYIVRYYPHKLLMKCLTPLMNHSLKESFPNPHKCQFGYKPFSTVYRITPLGLEF